MNIIVRTASGATYCRPDTTWERENKDLFVPDDVAAYCYAPVLFARISKAGKCVSEKFAGRYYDSIGFGVLLYVGNDLATGSCHDHTSILPTPLKEKAGLDDNALTCSFKMDDKLIFDAILEGCADMICKAISEASKIVSMRIGDYIAIELQQMMELTEREKQSRHLSADMDGESLFDFNMVF